MIKAPLSITFHSFESAARVMSSFTGVRALPPIHCLSAIAAPRVFAESV